MRQQKSENYAGYRQAGIRLTEPILPQLTTHRTQRIGDTIAAVHLFDKAHLVMLVEEGLISRSDGAAMLLALREMERVGVEQVRVEVQGGRHSGEQYLIRQLGEDVGGRINLGRSSGDLGAVGRRITIREYVLDLISQVNSLRSAVLDAAEQHVATIMPGYTHGQSAQPTTFGHWLSMWDRVFSRDVARLNELYARINQSPAGAGIMTGTDFAISRRRVAGLLGFDDVIPHTMDAIMSHDTDCLEAASVLAVHAANMSRIADDLELWFTSEFGFIDLPDRFCGTSSIMMQKKNPYIFEELKSAAASAMGALMTGFSVERGPTGLAILERNATERSLWSVLKTSIARASELAAVVENIDIDTTRMRESAAQFWAQGADVAGALVRETGIAWRSAHQIVGILVRHCYEQGVRPIDATTDRLDQASIEYWGRPAGLSASALSDALDVTLCVERRVLEGGPSPVVHLDALSDQRRGLNRDREIEVERRAALDASRQALEDAIDALVEAP